MGMTGKKKIITKQQKKEAKKIMRINLPLNPCPFSSRNLYYIN
jgi:hypothetical protein